MKKFLTLFVALLLCSVCMFTYGCGNNNGDLQGMVEDNGEQYEIVYYMPVGSTNDVVDLQRVNNALNNLLTTKLPKTTVKLITYNWFEYTGKMSPVIAANAKFDLCFTSPDFNSYLNNIAMEAFYPLNEMLPVYAPKTWAKFDKQLWEQTKVNGKIYAVLNNQILPRTASFGARDNVRFNEFCQEKYSTDIDNVYQYVSDPLDFMEEYLNWITSKRYGLGTGGAGITGYVDPAGVMQTWYGLDDLGTGMMVPGVVSVNETGKLTVFNQFETDEFDDIIDTVIRWRNTGIIPADASSRGNNLEQLDVNCSTTWKPNDIRYVADAVNKEGQIVRIGNPNYFTAFVLGTMNAISRTSQNPARVLKFLELMHTDKEVHNLLQYGEAGVDYTFVDGAHVDATNDTTTRRIELVTGSGYSNKGMGWALGDEFISYIQPTQADNQHEQEALINNSANMSQVIGFLFDPTPVSNEILACTGIYNTYFDASTGAGLGRADYNSGDRQSNLQKAQEFKDALKKAGAERIIAEKQRQLDAWLAAKA